jgi:hypothetical protein
VQPTRYDWGGEAAALREGKAFLWLPADTSGMHVEVVHTEPRVVAVWRGHRLARRKSISILDIRDDPLMWTKKAPRAWVDWWAVNPRPDGSAPVWDRPTTTLRKCSNRWLLPAIGDAERTARRRAWASAITRSRTSKGPDVPLTC